MSIDLYSEDLLAVDERGFERSEDEDDPRNIEEVIDGEVEPVGLSPGDGNNEHGAQGDGDGDGDQATSSETTKVAKKRKSQKNPHLLLNAVKLKGPKGILALSNHFKDVQYLGSGHEKEDLDRVLQRLEHWAHRLHPRYTFHDFLEKVERVGQKPDMKTYLKRIRLNMVMEDFKEIVDDADDANADEAMDVDDPDDPPPDMFDNLFDRPAPQQTTIVPPRASSPTALTDEQVERMRVNRLLAIEKTRQRLAKKKEEEEHLDNSVEQTSSEQEISSEGTRINNRVDSPVQSELSVPRSSNDTQSVPVPKDDHFMENVQKDRSVFEEVESETSCGLISDKPTASSSSNPSLTPSQQQQSMVQLADHEDENLGVDKCSVSAEPISIKETSLSVNKTLSSIENTMTDVESITLKKTGTSNLDVNSCDSIKMQVTTELVDHVTDTAAGCNTISESIS